MSVSHSTCAIIGEPEIRLVSGRWRSVVKVRCSGCDSERVVRADAIALKCRRCTSVAGGRAPKPTRRRGCDKVCVQCGQGYYYRPSQGNRSFCSRRCANEWKTWYPKEVRACASCAEAFSYSPKPHSNNSGRYCSLACRNKAYVGFYKGKPARGLGGHRPGWASVAKAFKAKGNRFCCLCGKTSGRLPVHHIEPYRVAQNNDAGNLVTLCPKCHSRMERISDRIEAMPASRRAAAVARVQRVLRRYWEANSPALSQDNRMW